MTRVIVLFAVLWSVAGYAQMLSAQPGLDLQPNSGHGNPCIALRPITPKLGSAPSIIGKAPHPMRSQSVSTVAELLSAIDDANVREIYVSTDLDGVPGFSLSPGQTLRGSPSDRVSITFQSGTDGVRLSSDNAVCSLQISVSPEKRSIWNSYSMPDLGTLTVEDVTATGQVQILAQDKIRAGHVEVQGLRILAADTRSAAERPQEYGVSVLQVWEHWFDPG